MVPVDTRLDERKRRAQAWFELLRDDLCAALQQVEADLPETAPCGDRAAGVFVRTPWVRQDETGAPGGGGTMSLLRGRVFEKAGIHTSTVQGEFASARALSQRTWPEYGSTQ